MKHGTDYASTTSYEAIPRGIRDDARKVLLWIANRANAEGRCKLVHKELRQLLRAKNNARVNAVVAELARAGKLLVSAWHHDTPSAVQIPAGKQLNTASLAMLARGGT